MGVQWDCRIKTRCMLSLIPSCLLTGCREGFRGGWTHCKAKQQCTAREDVASSTKGSEACEFILNQSGNTEMPEHLMLMSWWVFFFFLLSFHVISSSWVQHWCSIQFSWAAFMFLVLQFTILILGCCFLSLFSPVIEQVVQDLGKG